MCLLHSVPKLGFCSGDEEVALQLGKGAVLVRGGFSGPGCPHLDYVSGPSPLSGCDGGRRAHADGGGVWGRG